MKKKLLVALCMLVALSFAGCTGNDSSANSDKESGKETTTAGSQSDDSDNSTTAETTTVDEEALKKEKEEAAKKAAEECKKALESVEIEVLATYVSDFESSGIVSFDDVEYEKATYITLGMKFPEDVYDDYYSFFKIGGETATTSEGEPVSQKTTKSAWINDDENYLLAVVRIAGEVDVTKASVVITGDVDGVVVEKPFENSGQIVGFDNAKEAYKCDPETYGTESSVIKLKGRHYLINRRYSSSSGWGSSDEYEEGISTLTRSFVLIPLEGGFERTLTTEDGTLVSETEVEHTTAQLFINDRGMIDATAIDSQTTINIKISRGVVESKNEDDEYDDEVYDKISDDKELLALNTYVEIDDGDGNIVRLKAMSE